MWRPEALRALSALEIYEKPGWEVNFPPGLFIYFQGAEFLQKVVVYLPEILYNVVISERK